MPNTTRDTQSLTSFRKRSGTLLKELKESNRPLLLTVRGKAAAVVVDAEEYQRLLDIAGDADPQEGIRQGLEDAEGDRMRPVEKFFEEFEAAHGIRG